MPEAPQEAPGCRPLAHLWRPSEAALAACLCLVICAASGFAEEPPPKGDDAGKNAQGFTEEEEQKAPAPAAESGRNAVYIEYRSTDLFDPPPDPNLGPPADRVYYLAYETKLNRTNTLRFEGQEQTYRDEAKTDTGWGMVYWQRLLSTGATLGLETGAQWDADGGSGFWGAAKYGWAAGLNLDLAARLQISESIGNATGARVELDGNAALTSKTAVQGKAWYYWDDADTQAWRFEAELAQYVAPRTGLHALVRRNLSETDDPDATIPEASSNVASVELRHRLKCNTLARGGLRWYRDSEDINARGFSIGVEQTLGRGSLGVVFRHYRTNEYIHTDSWIFAWSLSF
jgi:hypothetical protein